jgi:hypothetical protein
MHSAYNIKIPNAPKAKSVYNSKKESASIVPSYFVEYWVLSNTAVWVLYSDELHVQFSLDGPSGCV